MVPKAGVVPPAVLEPNIPEVEAPPNMLGKDAGAASEDELAVRFPPPNILGKEKPGVLCVAAAAPPKREGVDALAAPKVLNEN